MPREVEWERMVLMVSSRLIVCFWHGWLRAWGRGRAVHFFNLSKTDSGYKEPSGCSDHLIKSGLLRQKEFYKHSTNCLQTLNQISFFSLLGLRFLLSSIPRRFLSLSISSTFIWNWFCKDSKLLSKLLLNSVFLFDSSNAVCKFEITSSFCRSWFSKEKYYGTFCI